jgi:cytochrome c peroxidase
VGCCAALLLATLAGATPIGATPVGATPFYSNDFPTHPSAATLTALGRSLFFDVSLSASGKLACSSCHDPRHAFGPPNALAVQRGGSDGRGYGARAVPSLMYAQNVPPFTEHFVDDDGNDSVDQGPAGGRTWDGRAQSAHSQAVLPLLSPFEMANSDAASVVSKVQRSRYAAQFRGAFGEEIFGEPELAFKGVLLALETYQQSATEFYPYTSKFDAWLRHEATLSPQETRGLEVFNEPAKGNCARCHPSAVRQGAFPQFTDFGYIALGVPRNARIPANRDANYFDLGLCGPLRADLRDKTQYCGMFRTPTLRNVAKRTVFFHNGAVRSLADAVRFYAERDTHPGKWYPTDADGKLRKYDDMPVKFADNVDVQGPFGQQAGEAPAFSEADEADLVAFLQTLSDGYVTTRRLRPAQ